MRPARVRDPVPEQQRLRVLPRGPTVRTGVPVKTHVRRAGAAHRTAAAVVVSDDKTPGQSRWLRLRPEQVGRRESDWPETTPRHPYGWKPAVATTDPFG